MALEIEGWGRGEVGGAGSGIARARGRCNAHAARFEG